MKQLGLMCQGVDMCQQVSPLLLQELLVQIPQVEGQGELLVGAAGHLAEGEASIVPDR